jgi:hypothetical protein
MRVITAIESHRKAPIDSQNKNITGVNLLNFLTSDLSHFNHFCATDRLQVLHTMTRQGGIAFPIITQSKQH